MYNKGFYTRRLLKNLSDEEYHDIMIFCDKFPHIEMTVDTEGNHAHFN